MIETIGIVVSAVAGIGAIVAVTWNLATARIGVVKEADYERDKAELIKVDICENRVDRVHARFDKVFAKLETIIEGQAETKESVAYIQGRIGNGLKN